MSSAWKNHPIIREYNIRGFSLIAISLIDDLRKSKGLHSVSAYGHGAVCIERVGTLLLGVQ